MQLPESERVVFEHNPLTEVVSQIRYSPVLVIGQKLPADFQDRLRADFPKLATATEQTVVALGSALRLNASSRYDFTSSDGHWTVSLSAMSLALTCRHYTRWEDFRLRWSEVLDAFWAVYAPIELTRIGLRYQNVIDRARLNLGDQAWSSLIKAPILGLLADSAFGTVEGYSSTSVFPIDDSDTKVFFNVGQVKHIQTNEAAVQIDSDFFVESNANRILENDPGAILARLDRFNRGIGNLFRFCITDHLHNALGPQRQ